MAIEVKTLADVNLAVQILLIITVSFAIYLAKDMKSGSHCTLMRIAVPVQVIMIVAIMLPSILGYITNEPPGLLFYTEMVVHHLLGLAVIVLWVYIIMSFRGSVKMPANIRTIMRTALISWVFSFILGIHMYVLIWGIPWMA